MRRLLFLALFFAMSCDSAPPAAQQASLDIRTINSAPSRPAKLEPPPVLSDEAPPPKPKVLPWETPAATVLTPDDERVRTALPFSPAIAMDPIDGDKISIRAATPTFEYKGRIYYFKTEANRRTFTANPTAYLTGKFTKL